MRNEMKKTEEPRYFYIGGRDLTQTQKETIGEELAQANSKDGWKGVKAVLEKYSGELTGATIRITDGAGKILFDGLFNQIMHWVEQQIVLKNQKPKKSVDKAQKQMIDMSEDQKRKAKTAKLKQNDLAIAEKNQPKTEEQKLFEKGPKTDFFT